MAEAWRRCSACKNPIAHGATYWVCNVSTCNRKRTGLAFCTVSCWEVHLPGANHRESWAVEKTAPSEAQAAAEAASAAGGGGGSGGGAAAASRPRRRIVRAEPPAAKPAPAAGPQAVLVIASRLKEYIRETTGLSTSDRVLEPLSDILRRLADEAARNAMRDGRRTVLDRDVPKP